MSSKAQYTAFDYGRQAWVTGEPARLLLKAQAEESLAILTGPRGADYMRVTGSKASDLPNAIAATQATLAGLGK